MNHSHTQRAVGHLARLTRGLALALALAVSASAQTHQWNWGLESSATGTPVCFGGRIQINPLSWGSGRTFVACIIPSGDYENWTTIEFQVVSGPGQLVQDYYPFGPQGPVITNNRVGPAPLLLYQSMVVEIDRRAPLGDYWWRARVDGQFDYYACLTLTTSPGGLRCFSTPTSPFQVTASPRLAGLELQLNGIPAGARQGWLLVTSCTTLPVGNGPVFGIIPDDCTLDIFFWPTTVAPVRWTSVQPGHLWPNVPWFLPAGTLPPGTTWDVVGLTHGPSGFAASNVLRMQL